MLLTFNLKFIKSNIAGGCLVWFQISRWPPGLDAWENRWWDIAGWQVAPSPSGSPPELCQWAGGVPNKASWGKLSPPWLLCSDSPLGEINSVCLLLAVIQMRMTHQGLPLPRVGSSASSASHGSGGCLMRLTGNCDICCTLGWAYSAPSEGGWQLSPHHGPPSHTKGSGSCHWSGIVCPGCVCPSVP